MKKSLIILLVICLAIVLTFSLVACNKNKGGDKVSIQSIEVTQMPTKLEYEQGENISLEGLKVKVTFSDGKTEEIAVDKLNITKPATTDVGEKEVKISYTVGDVTKEASFKINVKQHNHVYDQQKADAAYLKTNATCTAKAVYYKSCKCGEKGSETFESGEALGHDYDVTGKCKRQGCTSDVSKTLTKYEASGNGECAYGSVIFTPASDNKIYFNFTTNNIASSIYPSFDTCEQIEYKDPIDENTVNPVKSIVLYKEGALDNPITLPEDHCSDYFYWDGKYGDLENNTKYYVVVELDGQYESFKIYCLVVDLEYYDIEIDLEGAGFEEDNDYSYVKTHTSSPVSITATADHDIGAVQLKYVDYKTFNEDENWRDKLTTTAPTSGDWVVYAFVEGKDGVEDTEKYYVIKLKHTPGLDYICTIDGCNEFIGEEILEGRKDVSLDKGEKAYYAMNLTKGYYYFKAYAYGFKEDWSCVFQNPTGTAIPVTYNCNGEAFVNIPTSGKYRLIISNLNSNSEDFYVFVFYSCTEFEDIFDEENIITLNIRGEYDYYYFDLDAPSYLVFNQDYEISEFGVYIYDTNMNELYSLYDGGDQEGVVLDKGTYFMAIGAADYEDIPFFFHNVSLLDSQCVNCHGDLDIANPTELIPVTDQVKEFAIGEFVRPFKLILPAGVYQISLRINKESSPNYEYVLYDANNNEILISDGGEADSLLTVETEATYLLLVSCDGDGLNTGEVHIYINNYYPLEDNVSAPLVDGNNFYVLNLSQSIISFDFGGTYPKDFSLSNMEGPINNLLETDDCYEYAIPEAGMYLLHVNYIGVDNTIKYSVVNEITFDTSALATLEIGESRKFMMTGNVGEYIVSSNAANGEYNIAIFNPFQSILVETTENSLYLGNNSSLEYLIVVVTNILDDDKSISFKAHKHNFDKMGGTYCSGCDKYLDTTIIQPGNTKNDTYINIDNSQKYLVKELTANTEYIIEYNSNNSGEYDRKNGDFTFELYYLGEKVETFNTVNYRFVTPATLNGDYCIKLTNVAGDESGYMYFTLKLYN